MATPEVPQKKPYVSNEKAGKKAWCACGKSAKQPFCDGSHAGTGILPQIVDIEADRRVAWCGCKHTKTPPFCDGSHSKL